jgi:hypothetical protein
MKLTTLVALAVALLACTRESFDGSARQSSTTFDRAVATVSPKQAAPWSKYAGPIATITALAPLKTFSDQYWTTGFFLAEGTWVTVSPKRGVNVNTAIVRCSKEDGQCIESTSFVSLGGMLFAELDVLQIERWDDHEIVTKPDDAACARNVLRISREQRRVSELQSVFKTDGPCNLLTLGDTTRELQGGHDVAIELRSATGPAIK